MRTFLKIFIVSFLFFSLAYSLGAYLSIRKNDNTLVEEDIKIEDSQKLNNAIINPEDVEVIEQKEFEDIETALAEGSRKNFLVLGLEDVRSDVMILASFDREAKILDVISIPRDTYIHRKGYNRGSDRKINSIYYSHGIKGINQAVNYILNIPIDNHIIVDYEGVKEVVDIVGGVEVHVPFHMKYDDHTSSPPLHIDIKPGRQVLDGKNALDFIRWRKNNNNSTNYIDGDLGRIRAQHEFLKALLSKAKDNIVSVARHGFNYVDMDLNILETIMLAKDAYGIEEEKVRFYTLPGEHEYRTIDGVLNSYYIYNKEEIENLVEEIYNVKNTP